MSDLEDYIKKREGDFKDIDFELTVGALLSTTVLFISSGITWLDTFCNILAIIFLSIVGIRQLALKSISANKEQILKRSMIGVEITGLFLLLYIFIVPTAYIVNFLLEYGIEINPLMIFSPIVIAGVLGIFFFFESVFKDLAIYWGLQFREATENPLIRGFFDDMSNILITISFSPYRKNYLDVNENQKSSRTFRSYLPVIFIGLIFVGLNTLIPYLALDNFVLAVLTVFISMIGMGLIQVIYYLYGYSSFDSLNGDFTRGKLTIVSILIGMFYVYVVANYLV